LRSQIFKIFFASGGKGALTPLTEIPRTFLNNDDSRWYVSLLDPGRQKNNRQIDHRAEKIKSVGPRSYNWSGIDSINLIDLWILEAAGTVPSHSDRIMRPQMRRLRQLAVPAK